MTQYFQQLLQQAAAVVAVLTDLLTGMVKMAGQVVARDIQADQVLPQLEQVTHLLNRQVKAITVARTLVLIEVWAAAVAQEQLAALVVILTAVTAVLVLQIHIQVHL
jgi:hypothetical protein